MSPDPFITSADLSNYTGRDLSTDTGAVIAIDAACDICRDIAECSFNAGTATITLDGTDTDVLLLPEHPVTTVGTVNLMAAGTIAQSITEFEHTSDGRLLRGSAGNDPRPTWPRGRQNIQVTYEYGYGTATLPRSIRMVALSIASRLVIQGIAKSEVTGDARIDYSTAASTDLSAGEERILKRYRQSRSF